MTNITPAPQFMEEFHQHWWTVLIEGILLLVLGIAAIVLPLIAGLVITVILGWLLIFSGLIGLWSSWKMRKVRGTTWAVISSILALIAGIAFFVWPVGGLISLTLVLGAYFAVDGITTIAHAIQHRRDGTKNWGWLLVNGILDLLLAASVIIFQPGVNAWLVGLIVGIDLIFAGISLIAMGWLAKVHVVKLDT